MNVLIIGGSSDLGIEVAKSFCNKNNHVIVGYNKHIPKLSSVDLVKCDYQLEEDILNIIKYGIDKYGRIDVLINMGAIYHDSYGMDKTKDEFMNVLEVNLVGPFLAMQIYSKYIDDGLIINISSTDGIDTFNGYNIDYAASKAGIINISKSFSMVTNNKILCICANWIESNSTNLMDSKYLSMELERIKQSRLITKSEFVLGIHKIINMDSVSGNIFRMDIKGGKLWIIKI